MSLKYQHICFVALRWLLGATFIFSGFVKSVDPVGASIFVEKYLATYSLEALLPMALPVAIALGALELLLGLMVILRAMERYLYSLCFGLMVVFTLITLLSATLLPIGDCGCFGNAVMLTPWGTLLKNVVLLGVVYVLWRGRPQRAIFRRDYIILFAALFVSVGLNLYTLRYLPLIDFLPYKVGTDLRDSVTRERAAEEESLRNILICRNPQTGELREFDANDTSWYEWDVVDTRVEGGATADMTFSDFRIYDAAGGEHSLELLWRDGRVAWLCISDCAKLAGERLKGVERLFAHYPSEQIVVLSSDDCEAVATKLGVECYAVDAMTLRSMMRAAVGVIVLDDGVVEFKSDIRDI